MLEIIKSFFDLLKLKNRYISLIAFLSSILLFSPKEWIERIHLSSITENYKIYIGASFLVSISLLLINIITYIFSWIKQKIELKKFKSHIIKSLNSLTEEEKQILRYYYQFKTRSNRLRLDDGVAGGLRNKGILYIATQFGDIITGYDHNINEIAYEYILKNPKVLIGNTNTCRTDKNYYI